MFHTYPRPRTKLSWGQSKLIPNDFRLGQIHLINPEEIHSQDIEVKVRGIGLNPEGFAQLSFHPDQTLHVQLSSPAWAVVPDNRLSFIAKIG